MIFYVYARGLVPTGFGSWYACGSSTQRSDVSEHHNTHTETKTRLWEYRWIEMVSQTHLERQRLWHLAWVGSALCFSRPFILHCFVSNIIALEIFGSALSFACSCMFYTHIWRLRLRIWSLGSRICLTPRLHQHFLMNTCGIAWRGYLHCIFKQASACRFLLHSKASLRHCIALCQRIDTSIEYHLVHLRFQDSLPTPQTHELAAQNQHPMSPP